MYKYLKTPQTHFPFQFVVTHCLQVPDNQQDFQGLGQNESLAIL